MTPSAFVLLAIASIVPGPRALAATPSPKAPPPGFDTSDPSIQVHYFEQRTIYRIPFHSLSEKDLPIEKLPQTVTDWLPLQPRELRTSLQIKVKDSSSKRILPGYRLSWIGTSNQDRRIQRLHEILGLKQAQLETARITKMKKSELIEWKTRDYYFRVYSTVLDPKAGTLVTHFEAIRY